MVPTAFIYHEDFLKHNTGKQMYRLPSGHSMDVGLEFENGKRVAYIKDMLEKTGLLEHMKHVLPYEAAEEDLLRVHTQRHINDMRKKCQEGVRLLGSEVYGCQDSERIARLSAGGAMKAVDIVCNELEPINQAYALIRPPGHHAGANHAEGFCIYNNAAVAARYAIEKYPLKRVAIIDWDVHHGNGTQEIFYSQNQVLFMSIHEENYFPLYSGQLEEIGEGDGRGYNVNIPLPSGTGSAGYNIVFDHLIDPIIQQYQPDLIIVSAGQDPNGLDPLSRMRVMRPGFQAMAGKVREMASATSNARLVVLQEGGYSLPYLPIATLGVIEGMTNMYTEFQDPHGIPESPITDECLNSIEKCRMILSHNWNMQKERV
ncbi:acetoin utilization deacetylase AcuC-like enzyme [Scopulibacillus darangshiensis]|uniref:Acetoin utilization deacetylase AcuC-like enzyme n=2 Tax=Scopulibacillus darangshiensis TaxID=442528 RepID=A0A4R2P6W8_9BACL|nr:acetoin utilization deacetylase AcuC-like enzyme [Scopulibacillus darangshiensis]